jgi:hypothetical protein
MGNKQHRYENPFVFCSSLHFVGYRYQNLRVAYTWFYQTPVIKGPGKDPTLFGSIPSTLLLL